MEFETNLGFGDEPLFPDLEGIEFFADRTHELKKSPGHESVCSEMSEAPGPSPTMEDQNFDFEALLRETGLTVNEENNVISLDTGATLMNVSDEMANAPDDEGSEAPSSPAQSVSDVESFTAPSPAPSVVARRTRSSTRVRVASAASLSTVHEDEEPQRNKAAVQAKINREKKKAYISSLEQDKEALEKENVDLKDSNQRLNKENESLQEEVAYLKNIIANQSTLSNLLQNIPNVQGVCLTTSFTESRKRSAAHDHDYGAPPTKRGRASAAAVGGGVCLHVAGDQKVSLEFCKTCASMASGQGQQSKNS